MAPRSSSLLLPMVVGTGVALSLLSVPLWAAPKAASKPAAKPVSPTVAVSATTPAAAPVADITQSARVLWLDKQTNVRTPLVLVAGTPQVLNGLSVSVARCLPDYAGRPGQDVAWLEVKETETRQTPWFAGWMFSTAPEISTLDHPRYDLQLQGCGTQPRRIGRAVTAAEMGADGAPPTDSEAPSASTTEEDAAAAAAPTEGATPATEEATTPDTPTGGAPDPYYVPGVEPKPAAPVAIAPSPGQQPPSPPVIQPAAAGSRPAPQESQGELHKLMEGGVY